MSAVCIYITVQYCVPNKKLVYYYTIRTVGAAKIQYCSSDAARPVKKRFHRDLSWQAAADTTCLVTASLLTRLCLACIACRLRQRQRRPQITRLRSLLTVLERHVNHNQHYSRPKVQYRRRGQEGCSSSSSCESMNDYLVLTDCWRRITQSIRT
jgi:hypothetical protein